MIPVCASVYVETIKHAPHRAVIIIDSSKCEPGPHEYGRGLRITYGNDGQSIIIDHTYLKVDTMTVPLAGKIGKLKVENLGPIQQELENR